MRVVYMCTNVSFFFFKYTDSRVCDALFYIFFFTFTFLFYIYWQSEGKYVEELEDEENQAFVLHFYERLANISGLSFTYISGLFYLYIRSLLPTYQVSLT